MKKLFPRMLLLALFYSAIFVSAQSKNFKKIIESKDITEIEEFLKVAHHVKQSEYCKSYECN